MKASTFLFCALVAAAPLTAGIASAQPDIAKKEAQQRFDEGIHAYAAGKHEEARVKFAQAWATLKRPNVLFNLARAEHVTGHLVDAARHYRAYARMNDPKVSGADKAEADRRLLEIREKVGRILVTTPAGTTITIDGERVEEADLEGGLETEAGKHKVVASWAGKTKEVEISAAAGRVATVSFAFEDAAPASTPAPAPAPTATTSATQDTVTPPPREASPANAWPIVGWSLVGAGAVTAGVGVGFVFAANGAADDRDRLKATPAAAECPAPTPTCAELKDAAEARADRENLAKVLLGAGGALVVGGAVILLVKPGPRASSASRAPVVTPFFTPSLAGLSASGSF